MYDLHFWTQLGLGAWSVGIMLMISVLLLNWKSLVAPFTSGPLARSARAADLTVFAGRVLSHLLQLVLAILFSWLILPRMGIPQPRTAFALAICGLSWVMALRTLMIVSSVVRSRTPHPLGTKGGNSTRSPASFADIEESKHLTKQAYALVERNNYRQAKVVLERALELFENAEAHSELSLVHARMNRLPQAIRHIHRAIELQPDSARFWANLCFLYLATDQMECAIAAIGAADALDPGYPTVPIYQAQIATKLGRARSETVSLLRDARERYNQLGTRADGSALQFGDVERYINSTNLRRP